MMLVGSVSRKIMQQALDLQIGENAKMRAAASRLRRLERKRMKVKAPAKPEERKIPMEEVDCECMSGNDRVEANGYENANYALSFESDNTSGNEHSIAAANQRCHSAPSLRALQRRSSSNQKSLTTDQHKKSHYSVTGIVRNITHPFLHHHGKKHKGIPTFTPEEEKRWIEKQLRKSVDFSLIAIDDSPFQLVESCSLYKVHSLFSLLGVNRAYVTENGMLVGVVSLKELRLAIELAHAGAVELLSRSTDRNQQCNNTPVPTIIENLIDETDTDDDDVISPRAVLEDRQDSLGQLGRELSACRRGTETTFYSTGEDTDSIGTEHGKTSSHSLFIPVEPLADSLSSFLQVDVTVDDMRRPRSATDPNLCQTEGGLMRFESMPAGMK
uniref:CBS domain-containing protein n=2 Tax=Ascaris TaxID=6251 RepID=A0A9J2PLV6_ASCLU